jgi:prophage tail gpP-like protein
VVPSCRRLVFTVEDVPVGGLVTASQWKRSKQIVNCLTMAIPVASWYAPNGMLWSPGMMVTIKSATMEIPDGFTFLVRETEHVVDSSGYKCTIKVVPPQAYTAQPLQEPWVNSWTVTT